MNLDILIIGAGPAGLNMARAASAAGANYAVIERGGVAAAWRKLPHDLTMISPATPQVDWTSLPGLDIWKIGCKRPFPTQEDFVRYLETYREKFNLNVILRTEANSVSRISDGKFQVETNTGKIICRRLIVAAGIISNPYIPENIKGIPEVFHSIDFKEPTQFEGKKVVVIGGGNSAAEIIIKLAGWASELILCHPGQIKYHSETKQPEHIRGNSESILRELIQFGIVKNMPETIIEGYDGKIAGLSGLKVQADFVIAATGFRPHLDFLEKGNLKIQRKNHFPSVSMKLESVSEPGVFFTGSLTNVFPYSNFIHGFREDPNGFELRPDMF